MLVLSRKKDETIRIGEEVVVQIIEIRGDRVRLGIDAPRDVPVHREEVYRALHQLAGESRGDESPGEAEPVSLGARKTRTDGPAE